MYKEQINSYNYELGDCVQSVFAPVFSLHIVLVHAHASTMRATMCWPLLAAGRVAATQ